MWGEREKQKVENGAATWRTTLGVIWAVTIGSAEHFGRVGAPIGLFRAYKVLPARAYHASLWRFFCVVVGGHERQTLHMRRWLVGVLRPRVRPTFCWGGGGGRRKETRSGRNRTATDTLEARALAQTRYLERMAIPVELSKETRGEAKQGSQRAADEKGMQW